MKHWILFWTTVLGPLLTQGQGTVSLLENSPFMPPAKAGEGNEDETEGTPLALLQLRGITSIDGEYIFSIFDPSTRQSKWIRQGVQEDGLSIRGYNPDGNTVIIHSQPDNLSHQLQLNEYAQPTAASVPKAATTPATTPARTTQPTTSTSATNGGTASRTNRTVDTSRPSRRNLEILRERRQALADQLRQQSTPGSGASNNAQGRGTSRPSNR